MLRALGLLVLAPLSEGLRQTNLPDGVCNSFKLREESCNDMSPWRMDRNINSDYCGRLSRKDIPSQERLFQDIKNTFWKVSSRVPQNFLTTWNGIKTLQAMDMFATSDSWTEEDTQFVRKHANGAKILGGLGPQAVTTQAIKSQLPTCNDVYRRVSDKSLAIVAGHSAGNSKDGPKLGSAIDSHDEVVRFDSDVHAQLDRLQSGQKHHMSITTGFKTSHKDLLTFDLESEHLGKSYCNRFFANDEPVTGKVFMIRPSVYCRNHINTEDFSRGFLYYWFYGSMHKNVTYYDMDESYAKYKPAEEWIMSLIQRQKDQVKKGWNPDTDEDDF